MPIGSPELSVYYRGNAVYQRNASATQPKSPISAPHAKESAPPHSAKGEVFHSILRFLHLDSGLPHQNTETPHEEHSAASMAPRSADYDERAAPDGDASTASFLTNNSMGSIQRHESEFGADGHHGGGESRDGRPGGKKKRRSTIKSAFTSLFFPSERTKKIPPLPKGVDKTQSEHEDDIRAFAVILEIDEDDEREEILHAETAVLDILILNFHSDLKVLRERTLWDSEAGGEVTEEQLHTMYYHFFRQMKALLSQQFSQVFPRGVGGTALSMADVAACVAGLLMVEMAITDEDMHSFAFNVLGGRRISLQNCPPSRRYLYFTFMAFKSIVPAFRAHTDAFRTAVIRYFYDHNSIRKAGHPFALPLQALLNALAPVMMATDFQKMSPSFYYYALKLERERTGVDDEDNIVDDLSTPTKMVHQDPNHDSGNGSSAHVSRSCSEEFSGGGPHNPQEATHHAKCADVPAESTSGVDGDPSATVIARRRARRPSASGQWSTIVQNYRKGQVLGRGACGIVYRCTDANNGVFYALKELSLLTRGMVRRIRRHQEQQQEDLLEGSATTGMNSSTSSVVRLDQILTEQEQDELIWREKSICGEVNMLKTLRNPYIVSYYGCSFDRRSLKVSILMEFCPKTLRAIIDELGPMRLSMIAHYATQILLGISFLHDNHVVHRDIKAANILVKDSGEAKVSDFGTAILNEIRSGDGPTATNSSEAVDDELDTLRRETTTADEDLATLFTSSRTARHHHHGHHHGHQKHSKTRHHHHDKGVRKSQAGLHAFAIQGTSLFLAPEVAKGCLPTEASDVWSFGCLLIEMATGEYPWHEWTEGRDLPLEMVVFHVAMSQHPPLLSAELAPRAAANPDFVDLLASCLRIDPVARPTCRQLLQHPFFAHASLDVESDNSGDPIGGGSPAEHEATGESGDLAEDDSGAVLGGNIMCLVPNDSMVGPSGAYEPSGVYE